ncbi:hypothetical protein [Phenylobacterium sp.]|uniref:hypothetical protein n=1 Tax=Phenylobacterium sp. TaxID=1871053 RepID=UPI00286D126C|nr:hypothetical protein [Phenylobacterium sp.]
MKPSILILATGVSLAAAVVAAQPLRENPPASTVICLDVAGRSLPATCKVPASRLDRREDICLCAGDGERVTTPICAAGVRPPAESAAYERARRKAVVHGSLLAATWQGQSMCVAPRDPVIGR